MTNIADLVKEAAASRPQHPALVTRSSSLTWQEFDGRVDRAAAAFAAEFPQRGTRVALMIGNRPEFAVAYFGLLRAGHVAVPLNTSYTAHEVTKLVVDSGARLLLHQASAGKVAASTQRKCPEVKVVSVDSDMAGDYLGLGEAPEVGFKAPRTTSRDLAVLMFTSGSEGQPKGAMLTHAALRANIDALARLRRPAAMTPDDVVLMVLPLFHIYGLNAGLGLAARKGATCVLIDRFDPRSSLGVIRDLGVTNVAGAPPMYVAWTTQESLRASMRNVRILISGASALPIEVFHQFQTITGLPIWEGYGLTECAPVVTSTLVSGVAKAGSVGQPVSGVEVSLRDESGSPVDDGDPGEVWVRAKSLFSGYWPEGTGGPDAAGWFATGDVAICDDDGDYHLVDRRRDLIIVSGFNVYPREVEDVIGSHPAVAECAVVGIDHPMTGEAVRAVVVLKKGMSEPDDLLEFCLARLARFKCPSIIQYATKLPRAATGKITKGKLKGLRE